MSLLIASSRLDRIAWYRENRARSRAIFDILADDAYLSRPIPLRHPFVFYEGHIPAFSVNTLLRKSLGQSGVEPRFEELFARGIDPADEAAATQSRIDVWPDRASVLAYGARVDERIESALAMLERGVSIESPVSPHEAALTILEHEEMHHETLLYLLHELSRTKKRVTAPLGHAGPPGESTPASHDRVRIPKGVATLGSNRSDTPFGWDNELPSLTVEVGELEIDRHNVTNGEFMKFVKASGYATKEFWSDEGWTWITSEEIDHPHFWVQRDSVWFWRQMFGESPLPEMSPVYVSHAEAEAYARWTGRRLPTEAEYHRAAFGTPSGVERRHPWGDAAPDASRGNFGFTHWDPLPIGSFPQGASAWGVHDLVGNGWEWTATIFDGFPGFEPMPPYPEYSIDFFDGKHFVLKGASPATSIHLIRREFRNWFRPIYPYVYATFRCVDS